MFLYTGGASQGSSNATQFVYDGIGNRIAKKTGSSEVRYVNDVSGSLPYVLAETNASNTIQNYYVYGVGLISQGSSSASARSYPLTDGMGNVRFVTNATGGKVAGYAYEIIPDCRLRTLRKIITGKIDLSSTAYSDSWRGYNGLVDVGFDKHFRIYHIFISIFINCKRAYNIDNNDIL